MGGKGQRRREKNYKAAHGGGENARLPPPPDYSSVDAVPSKLRQIMSLSGSERQHKKRNPDSGVHKGTHSGEGSESMTTGTKRKRDDQISMAQHKGDGDEADDKKKKKKKKGKRVDDLRFETLDRLGGAGSQRKERKKQRLEARKKKNKRPSTEEDMEFEGREEIQFGDVVQAPPKLITVTKAFKKIQDASQERLRLQAVDAYRKRKGWESRPGVQLPPFQKMI